jgi:hypothetical protein
MSFSRYITTPQAHDPRPGGRQHRRAVALRLTDERWGDVPDRAKFGP